MKAQIHAGGRGKGGGVKLARSIDEVKQRASEILGMQLVTHQTGPGGQKVRRLLIEEGADIAKELYVGMVVDRATQRVTLMASSEGGMDIEEVAAHTPEKIHKVHIDPALGMTDHDADDIATKIGIPAASIPQARAVLQGLYKAFWETDASLAEINPLILTKDGRVVALDAKLNFDSNALFRHPEIVELRDLDEEDPAEVEASKFDLSYIQLDGNIGCLVNGAGLAMATMDTIKLFGGEPANFLDVGGGATAEKVTEAFKLMLRNPGLKAILVNIFGGIMKCDTIAEGVVAGLARGAPQSAAGGAHEGHQRADRQEDPGGLRPADHFRRHDGRSRREGGCRGQGPLDANETDDEHPDQQELPRHHAGHHRQDRPVPYPRLPRIRQRQELLRRRRPSEEGRRGLRGHPDLRQRQGRQGRNRRQCLGDLRAAGGCGRRDLGGGRRRSRSRHLHHRRHPGARHDRRARQDAEGATRRRCCSGRTARARSRRTKSRSASCRATSTARAASAWCRARAR